MQRNNIGSLFGLIFVGVLWWNGFFDDWILNSPAPNLASVRVRAQMGGRTPRAFPTLEEMPHEEELFITAVNAARILYDAAANEMQQGGQRAVRARDVCDALKRDAHASEWRGLTKTLTSNGDGNGVLGIEIAPDIVIRTVNNSFSDIGYATLIPAGSALFAKASALHIGERVVFSGSFFPSKTDCVTENSVTLEGSMKTPGYVFRFSDVRASP